MPIKNTAGRTRGRQPKRLDNDPTLESPLDRPLLAQRLEVEVGPLADQKKSITSREWTFIQELVAGEGHVTPKEAAIRAGYPQKDAVSIANTLTNPQKNPHILAGIKEYRKTLAEKYGTTYERHMRDLMLIRDKALEAGNYGAAVTAEYRRGQALGSIYIDRKEIRHGTIDSMSKEDVMRKLEEIRKVYGARPADVSDLEVKDGTREGSLPAIEGEPEASTSAADRVESDIGDAGLPGSFEWEIDYDRAEGDKGKKG